MPGIANATPLWAIGALFAALAIGSLVRWVAVRRAAADVAAQRIGSLKTWWVLTGLLALAVLSGKWGAVLMFAVVSSLGLREYVRLLPLRETDRPAAAVAFACIPINYLLIAAEWQAAFAVFVPIGGLMLLAASRAFGRETQNYIRLTAGLYWGLLLLVYALSHAALLFTLPEDSNPVAGSAGWFLFVVILTEIDDIAQALVGRRVGRHKITPVVSPNKTWEGFIGGVSVTVALALLLAPLLTPLADSNVLEAWGVPWPVPYLWAGIAGAGISLSGFLGDINMSAIKRDAGVKDGSALLPGQGGMIDRVDSLTFSAPCFYYFVVGISG